jgi:hypothetical protein
MFELTNEELRAVSGGYCGSRAIAQASMWASANGGNGGAGGRGGRGGDAMGGLFIIEIGFPGSVFYNIANTIAGNGGNGGNGGAAGNGGIAIAGNSNAWT